MAKMTSYKKLNTRYMLPFPIKISLLVKYGDPELYPGTNSLFDAVNSIEDIKSWQSDSIDIADNVVRRRNVLREDNGYETGKNKFLFFLFFYSLLNIEK